MSAKVNISELSRMYGKDRKTVHDAIRKHNISTEKTSRATLVQLVDMVTIWGEPKNLPTPPSQLNEEESTQEATLITTPFFEEKIRLLEQQVEEMRKDKDVLRQEKERLMTMLESEQEKTRALLLEDRREQRGFWGRVFGT